MDKEEDRKPGTILGAKWLIRNERDATQIKKDARIRRRTAQLSANVGNVSLAAGTGLLGILQKHKPADQSNEIFETSLTIEKIQQLYDDELSDAERREVDALVEQFGERSAILDDEIGAVVAALKRRPQFSLAFQTTQREDALADDYRVSIIYDQGWADRLFVTLNASYDYSNRTIVGGDVRGARGAVDFRWTLAAPPDSSLKSPLTFALSGEGLRKADQWQYRAQAQLQIPIATGISLPISFGYGNRPELLRQQEKDVYGKFGITFDLQKALKAIAGPALR